MRVSMDTKDPGFTYGFEHKVNLIGGIEISCDGQRIDCCITADDERDFAVIYRLDACRDASWSVDKPVVEIVRGRIDIRLVKEPDGTWGHFGIPRPVTDGVDMRGSGLLPPANCPFDLRPGFDEDFVVFTSPVGFV